MPIKIKSTSSRKKSLGKERQKPININGKSLWFYEFKEELRKIKSSNKGKLLKGSDYNMARCALQRRIPSLSESFNPPIKIDIHPIWKEYCFMYKTIDDEWEPFSLKKAATKSKSTIDSQNVKKSFRCEVATQIYVFKMAELKKPKNKKLYLLYQEDSKKVHCDHIIQMYKLINSFCENYGIALSDIEITQHPEFEDSYLFKDRILAKEWALFHQKYAKLRLVTGDENMERMLTEDVHQWRFDKQMKEF